ncbi:MAG: DUF1592 domain-containing protein [Myxococcota bacterium]
MRARKPLELAFLGAVALGVTLGAGACRSSEPGVSEGDSSGGPSEMDPDQEPEPEPESEPEPQEPLFAAPLRRLTEAQYLAVVEQQLGVDVSELSLPADGRVGPFVGNASAPLSGLHIDQYFAAAQQIAEQVELSALHPCGEAPADECVSDFIDDVGAALWRRPVPDEDRGRLLAVYDVGREAREPAAALRLVVVALLQSPYMLYHIEIGVEIGVEIGEPVDGEGTAFRLDGYEVASRLSFLLWNMAPDAELREAAATGELDTAEGIRARAERMLDDPRAAEQVGNFHIQWLGAEGLQYLAKDLERYPVWSEPALRDDLRQEIIDFTSHVVLEAQGSAGNLVTAPYSFPRGDLFRIYGLVEPPGHDPSQPVGLDPQERSGVLTMPGVLASHAAAAETSPVHRGLFVLENLLCVEIAGPPPELDTSLPNVDPDQAPSRRELLEQHEQDPACAGCHVIIDPMGLLFEHYDAIGAWRDYDYDYDSEIDTAVVIETSTDVSGAMQAVPELGQAMAASEDYRRCMIEQWSRFALGRELGSADEDALDALSEQGADDLVIRELILDLVASDMFRHRPPHPAS